jgi:hypothetical protein
VYTVPVAVFFTTMSAPGTTAPDESVTVHEIVDVDPPCAKAGAVATIVARIISNKRRVSRGVQ